MLYGNIKYMKQADFLSLFLDSVVRARLVRIFLANQSEALTSEIIIKRAGVARGAITREIKRLENMNLIKVTHVMVRTDTKKKSKKEKAWILNGQFQYITTLSNFVSDVSPAQFDLIAATLKKAGKVSTIVLSGSFLNDPSRPVDILMAADELQKKGLEKALRILEQLFGREIRYAAFPVGEFRYRMTIQDKLLRDTLDYPHTVLLDKGGLL